MNILLLGTIYPENHNEFIDLSKVMPQYAANRVCKFYWQAFKELPDVNIDLLNIVPIASFPFHHKLKSVPEIKLSEKFINVGYNNMCGIRQFSRMKNAMRSVGFWVRENVNQKDKVVVAYSMSLHNLCSLAKAKMIDSTITTCLIVPDLPHYMVLNPSIIYRLLKKIDITLQKCLMKYVDSYVLVTKHMAKFLNIEDKPYTVIEGMVDFPDSIVTKQKEMKDRQRKIVLYSGSLESAYGIGDLLTAFSYIKSEEYILQILGDGNAKDKVIEAANRDKRIRYLGVQPTEVVLQMQKKATLLVNPRPGIDIYTRYSFPSKIIEYLSSGTPVLTHKLDGIPDEYDDYLYYFKSNIPKEMAQQIECTCLQVCGVELAKDEKGKEFVNSKKNYLEQGKKLYAMLLKIIN